MLAQDLDQRELLQLDPGSGVIHFAGQRALLIDAVAMGTLRRYLVENFGESAARAVLTQFGFAHGWRVAESFKKQFKWASDEEWLRAGPRIHTLQGLFLLDASVQDPLSKAGATLLSSYEAEQHLLHFGRAEDPVCWTICGLISGYISRATGKEVYVLEDRCLSRGDAACHLMGRTREEWGDERAEELAFFEKTRLDDCLDVSLQRVTQTLKAAERKLLKRRRALVRIAPEVDEPFGIVARSGQMREVVDLAQRIAKVDSTIVITGESGSGKERIAQLVHGESTRAAGPFIAVNCGAIAESLLESELFGHARGAFTGATQDRPGLFEAASGGTLLLDEIGEVPAAMQVKLLRVLQEREIRRVGENKTRPIDVRILAATNRDLGACVADGSFREDLFYRLRVVDLRVPPLRERHEDILPLARVLLADAAARMGRELEGISPAAADQLVRYTWPGNVRELENAMERATALARGSRVELEDLPEEVRAGTREQSTPASRLGGGPVEPLRDVEKAYILSALGLNEGNQTRTAEQLQIGAATLYRKLKSYGMTTPRGTSRK
jgi:DNA-binding NtrC family response regulator